MEWIWKIDSLMKQADIHKTSVLAGEIKDACPDLNKRTISEDTLKRMLNGTLIEIKAAGIVAICRYFRLHSITQLIDFDTALPAPATSWNKGLAVDIDFRIQKLIKELSLSQNQITERSGCSPVTINALYHGRNGTINFRVLKQVIIAVSELSQAQVGESRPKSISELIEIVTEDKLHEPLEFNQMNLRKLDTARLTKLW